MSDQELDDLTNLVKSAGWLRLTAHITEEWTAKLEQGSEACANDDDDIKALNKLRQVMAVKKALRNLLAWPEERMRHLKGQDMKAQQAPNLSRGGFA